MVEMPGISSRNRLTVKIAELIATFFYLGYLPPAPGTVGAAAGLAWWLIIHRLAPELLPGHITETGWGVLVFLAVFFLAGVWSSGKMEKTTGIEDPPWIIIDEVFSIFITFFAVSVPTGGGGWLFLLAGLILNRIFDIFKPPPIRRLERVRGGWGVMLDDLAAGIYSNLALRLILLTI